MFLLVLLLATGLLVASLESSAECEGERMFRVLQAIRERKKKKEENTEKL